MIFNYKGRRAARGDRVMVYRRLTGPNHKIVKWSIVDPRTSLVIGHADEVLLRDVEFRVREGGHARMLATGQKNVHAFAVGRLGEDGEILPFADTVVHYNPRRGASFTDHTGEAIDSAKKVYFDPNGKVWAS
jgi:hypothetical protein